MTNVISFYCLNDWLAILNTCNQGNEHQLENYRKCYVCPRSTHMLSQPSGHSFSFGQYIAINTLCLRTKESKISKGELKFSILTFKTKTNGCLRTNINMPAQTNNKLYIF